MQRASLVFVIAAALTLAATAALAQESVTVTLHPRAILGDGGLSLQLAVDIACEDLGTEDIQQGLAFATQERGSLSLTGEGAWTARSSAMACLGPTRQRSPCSRDRSSTEGPLSRPSPSWSVSSTTTISRCAGRTTTRCPSWWPGEPSNLHRSLGAGRPSLLGVRLGARYRRSAMQVGLPWWSLDG